MKDEMKEKLKEYVALKLVSELGGINGRTKFQKIVFIGQKERRLPEVFKFNGYYYGPYSKELTDTIEMLIKLGLINEKVIIGEEYIEYIYTITEEGKGALKRLEMEMEDKPKIAIPYLKKFKKMSRGEIIGYVYSKYMLPNS